MFKKWVLFAVLLLFLLAVPFYAVTRSGSVSEKIKHYAESSLQSFLGQPVKVEEAEFRLFSPSVILKKVATKGRPPAGPVPPGPMPAPMMVAEEIRIYFSPWSLFTEAFFIRKIEIHSPSLLLDSKALGEKPFAFDLRVKNKKGVLPPVIVRSIEIHDGWLSYRGEGTLRTFSLQKIAATVRSNLKMDRFEIELAGGSGEISTEKFKKKVDRLEGNLIASPDRFHLQKLQVASSKTLFQGEGSFRVGEKEPLNLRFEAHLPIEELDLASITEGSIFAEKNLAGEAKVQGHLTGAFPNVALSGKVALLRFLVGGAEVGSLASDLSYKNGRILFSSLTGGIFSGSFTGEAEGALSLPGADPDPSEKPLPFRLALQYKQLPLEKARQIVSQPGQRAFRSLEGILLDGTISVTCSTPSCPGQAGHPDWKAEGQVIAKRHPLFSAPVSDASDPLDRLIALFREGELGWRWSDRRLTVAPGVLTLPHTKVTVQGEWAPESGWRLDSLAESDEIEQIAGALHLSVTGRMKAQGRLSGKKFPDSFRGEARLDRWTLLKQPFGPLSAQFASQGSTLLFDHGSLETPAPTKQGGTLHVKGAASEPPYRFKGTLSLADPLSFDFQVEAAAADPQEFITLFNQSIPFQTRATGRLAIRGTPNAFSVRGPLVLAKGSLYGERFARGKVELTVTEKEIRFRKAVLDQQKSRVEGEGEIGYDGTYRVALKANRLRIDDTRFFHSRLPLLSGNMGLEVFGKGSFKKPALKLLATVQNLRYGEMEEVRGTVKVNWNDRSVQVAGDFPGKKVSLTGEILLTEGSPFSFRSHFDRLQIDPFFKGRLSGPLSNMHLLVSGEMKGRGKLSRLDQTSLAGWLTEMQADFSGYPIQNDGPVAVSSREGVFEFDHAKFKGENTALEFNGALTLLKEWDLFVTGEADLNLVRFFTDEISSGKGKAHLDLQISDRWEQPQIRGALTLQNGTIRTATLSQTVHISSLSVVFNERQLILETLEGEMGRGRFYGSGKADLIGFGVGPFSFILTLEEARVRLLPDLAATMDGELLFQRKGKNQSQTLQGELILKKAVYQKRVDLKSLVVNSRKTREVSLHSETPVLGGTRLNIHLYGKEEILIKNNIAKIPLEIDLFLKGSFDEPLLIGRIDLPEGHVYFRRNDFEILSGSLEFLNPDKIDPTFDIKAKTEIRNFASNITYAIDLNLTGTLSQFTLTLTSFPSLPEADILSLLALGKTTAEIAQTQKGGGGSEATSFVVSEFLDLEPIHKLTGIDRIQVDPYTGGAKSSTGTRLTAEKSLLEGRLLLIYSTTLDPSEEDLIRMVYEVNKNVSLAGKRDEKGQIGGDLRFRFEFR